MVQPPQRSKVDVTGTIGRAILDLVAQVPATNEKPSATPEERAETIRKAAALKAAAVSGTLALPPGPLGVMTILPDLVAVWRIQSQMVADIAGAFGKTSHLEQSHMIYCLFRHAAAQTIRDLAARVGERFIFHRLTLKALESVTKRLGLKVSQRVLAQSVARWLPVIGSVGVAGYAYYDTLQVGGTAVELFERELETVVDAEFVETDKSTLA